MRNTGKYQALCFETLARGGRCGALVYAELIGAGICLMHGPAENARDRPDISVGIVPADDPIVSASPAASVHFFPFAFFEAFAGARFSALAFAAASSSRRILLASTSSAAAAASKAFGFVSPLYCQTCNS